MANEFGGLGILVKTVFSASRGLSMAHTRTGGTLHLRIISSNRALLPAADRAFACQNSKKQPLLAEKFLAPAAAATESSGREDREKDERLSHCEFVYICAALDSEGIKPLFIDFLGRKSELIPNYNLFTI